MTNKLKEAMKNVETQEEADRKSAKLAGYPEPPLTVAPPEEISHAPGSADQAEYAVEQALSGPTFIQTEFTDWRKERLRQDEAELLAQVADIDDQIAVLNARRDNAMLAVSGITADLMAMDK